MPIDSDKRLLTRLMTKAFRRAVLLPFLLFLVALGAVFDYTFLWVVPGALLISEIVVILYERWQHIELNSGENANLFVEVIRDSWNLRQQTHWHKNYLNDGSIPNKHLIFERPNADVRGSFRIARLGLVHSFRYRTDPLGRRITSEADLSEKSDDDNRPAISVYGCSCTWGVGVNDEETYPWLLQQEFPEYRIINRGVTGFSPYEMLLYMRETLAIDQPKVVVLGFHPSVDARNTGQYPQMWWFTGPRCISLRMRGKNRRELRTLRPTRIGFSVKALPPTLRMLVSEYLRSPLRKVNRTGYIQRTMEHVFLQMRKCVESENASLLVACLDQRNKYGEFLDQHNFSWTQSCTNSAELVDGSAPWSLYPFDTHPNAAAQKQFAESISDGLRSLLEGKRFCPTTTVRGNIRLPSNRHDSETERFIYPLF